MHVSSPQDDDKKWREQLYQAQALKCQDGGHDALRTFDNSVLTLSAGALGVSLAFIKDVVPISLAINLNLLFWSWGLFAGAMLCTLCSFIASRQAFEHQKEASYRYYIEQIIEQPKASVWALITRFLTYAEGLCFVAGLALTLVFAVQNLRHASGIIKTNSESFVNNKIEHAPPPNQVQRGVEPSGLIKVPEPNRVVLPNNAPPVHPTHNPTPPAKEK